MKYMSDCKARLLSCRAVRKQKYSGYTKYRPAFLGKPAGTDSLKKIFPYKQTPAGLAGHPAPERILLILEI